MRILNEGMNIYKGGVTGVIGLVMHKEQEDKNKEQEEKTCDCFGHYCKALQEEEDCRDCNCRDCLADCCKELWCEPWSEDEAFGFCCCLTWICCVILGSGG